MLRVSLILLSICCAGLHATVGFAQDNPLGFFSKDVGVIVRLREPDQTFEKVAKFVERVQPGVGPVVQDQQEPLLGKLSSNPTLTGADQTRDWYVGVYAIENEPPTVVFAVPTTNSGDFVSALGTNFQTRQEKNWVIYTDAATLPAVSASESAATALSKEIQTRLADGDLTVYVNARHLTSVYSTQIKLLQEKVQESLTQLSALSVQPGINAEGIAKMYGSMIEGFFQSVQDSDTVGLSLSLSEKDLIISHQTDFKSDSVSAKFLANNPQSSFDDLARLPSGWPIYSGVSCDTRGLIEWGTQFSTSLYEVPPEKQAQLEKALKIDSDVKFGSFVSAADVSPTVNDALRQVSIYEISPASKYRESIYDLQAAVGNLKNGLMEQTMTIQRDAESFGAYKGDIITVKQEYTAEGDPTGVTTKMLDVLTGPDGVVTRNVSLQDKFVNTVGGGKRLMEQTITAIEEKKTNRIAKFREGLPPTGNFLLLIDLPGTIARGVKLASKVEDSPLMVNPDAVDNLGLTPSYISFVAGSKGDTATSQLRIPVEQVVGIAKVSVLIGASMKPGL